MRDLPFPPSPEGARDPVQMRDTARITVEAALDAFERRDAKLHAKCLVLLGMIVDSAATEIEIPRLKSGQSLPPES
jgi:hypothetical protein